MPEKQKIAELRKTETFFPESHGMADAKRTVKKNNTKEQCQPKIDIVLFSVDIVLLLCIFLQNTAHYAIILPKNDNLKGFL